MKISTNTFVVRTGAFIAGILVVFALSQLVQWSTAEAQTPDGGDAVATSSPETASVSIRKVLDSANFEGNLDVEDFNFQISDDNGVIGTFGHDEVFELPEGEYEILEIGPVGFVPDMWTVLWGGPYCESTLEVGAENAPASVPGKFIVTPSMVDKNNPDNPWNCSAENQYKPGTLQVQKVISGTTTVPYTTFSFTVNGGDPITFESDGTKDVDVVAGAYEIEEVPVSGYISTYSEGCSGSVANQENVQCVITNTWTGGNGGNEIPGCTDPLANNYNPLATEDDGSCLYDNGGQCIDETQGSFADDVVSSDQGLRLDNSSVLAERSNPNSTLGSNGGSFFSLGFGGEIVVEFDSYVPNVAGNDFTVYEVTNGDYPEESAEVYVRQVTATSTGVWHLVGEANNLAGDNTTSFDFDSTGLDWINQIRLVDTTNAADFPGTYSNASLPDGFDLDAIEATQQVCDEPGDGGNGGDEDVYLVYGYVWHDENENGNWEQEQPNPEDNETDLSGWTVEITNGEETQSTTTDADGYYYFYVPAGTWTINQVVMTNWEQTFPNVNGHVVVVGVDENQAQAEPTNFFAQMLSFIIPTALAAQIDDNNACDPFCGPHDFGNVFRGDSGGGYSQGSYGGGNGTRIELTSSGGSNDDDDDDGPIPQVLGEATSAIPQGAPYTGAGGAAPLSVNLPTLLAVLTTSQRSVRASHAK